MNLFQSMIVAIFIGFGMSFLLIWVFQILFNKSFTKEIRILYSLSIILCCTFSFFMSKYFPNISNSVLVKIILSLSAMVMCTRLVLKLKYYQIGLSLFLLFIINSIGDAAVVTILSVVGINVEQAKNSFYLYFLASCLILFSDFMFLWVINFLKKIKNIQIPYELKKEYIKNLMPSMMIIVCLILSDVYLRDQRSGDIVDASMILPNLIACFLFMFFSMIYFNNIVKLSKWSIELELQ